MSSTLPAIIDTEAFAKIEDVAKLMAEGKTSPLAIARTLGIKVVDAKAAMEQWHELLRQDDESRDAAREALNLMLQRYDKLLVEANANLKNLQSLEFGEKVSAQIVATIKVIGDLDAKRVDTLQKAGLLDAHDLGDDLAEREEREQMLLNILRNDLCDACKITVRDKLTIMTGSVEGTVVDG